MYADPGSASISSVAARARRRPSSRSPCSRSCVPRPAGFAKRVACRVTSWLDSTQVVGAPTGRIAAREPSMTSRSSLASQLAVRYWKLKAWCISSGRTYRAVRSTVGVQASATRTRSPSYSSRIRRQERYISWTPSWSKKGMTSLPSSLSWSLAPRSGRPGALTRPWATSTRKPSAPRSSQKRRIERNSSWTAGCSQLKSGCSGANRCRYHSPSSTRVQAGPPKMDSQSLGGSSPFSPWPGRKWKRSRSREPDPSRSACLNHSCWSEQWFGTRSTMMRRPSSWASRITASASCRVPNIGSMAR